MNTHVTVYATGIDVQNPYWVFLQTFNTLYDSWFFWKFVLILITMLVITLIKKWIRHKNRERRERNRAKIWKEEMKW